ncbi:hypothetical protein D3C86_1333620 [compost metagenome]
MGKGRAEQADGHRQRLHGVHHVHRDRQLGLQPFGHGARLGLEAVHAAHDHAGFREEGGALLGELRVTRRAVEQLHVDLRLEVGQRLADDRLRPAQLAARRREAAFVCRRDEGAQLVHGQAVEHLSFLWMDCIERYRLLRGMSSS